MGLILGSLIMKRILLPEIWGVCICGGGGWGGGVNIIKCKDSGKLGRGGK